MPAGFLHYRSIDSRVEGERLLLAPRQRIWDSDE